MLHQALLDLQPRNVSCLVLEFDFEDQRLEVEVGIVDFFELGLGSNLGRLSIVKFDLFSGFELWKRTVSLAPDCWVRSGDIPSLFSVISS